jgi:hypothetical protein
MSHRAKLKMGTCNPDRWMAEVFYRDATPTLILKFEELEDLDEIIEHGPDWNTIDRIVITLNRWPLYEGDSQ